MRPALITLLLVAGLSLGTACGGGGGGDGGGSNPDPQGAPAATGLAALEGSWLGVMTDEHNLDGIQMRFEIDAEGHVWEIAYPTWVSDDTATITRISERNFVMQRTNGHRHNMWTDAENRHAGLVREGRHLGVLEKGATGLPGPYAEADVLGASFTGTAVSIDEHYDATGVAHAQLALDSEGGPSGVVGTIGFVPHPVPLLPWSLDPNTSRARTSYVDSEGKEGGIVFLLTPDKRVMFGTANWDPDFSIPCCDDRVFMLLTRD